MLPYINFSGGGGVFNIQNKRKNLKNSRPYIDPHTVYMFINMSFCISNYSGLCKGVLSIASEAIFTKFSYANFLRRKIGIH